MMVSNEEKRWLVVGIAMNKVAAPVLRDFIKQGMDTHYANNTYCHGVTTPCTLNTLTYHHASADPNLRRLKFQNINNNRSNHGNHRNLYNYNVNSSVDLAKLFLPDYLAEFSGFDESLDISAILRLLGCNNPAPIFHSPNPLISIQLSADDVRENVRNKWGHCNVTDWSEVLFNDCFSKLETLVRSLGLTGGVETTTLDQLSDWQTKGCQLCMGHAVDKALLSLVNQDIKGIIADLAGHDARLDAVETKLQKEEEDRRKETDKILELLVSMKKMLSEELLRRIEGMEQRVEGVEQGLAETNIKVEVQGKRVEGAEQGLATANLKVEELGQGMALLQDSLTKTDDKVEQLEHEIKSQRMEDVKPESSRGQRSRYDSDLKSELPEEPTNIHGHVTEVNDIVQALSDNSNKAVPVVLVSGISGIGKTTVAIQACYQLTSKHGSIVKVCSLRCVQSGEERSSDHEESKGERELREILDVCVPGQHQADENPRHVLLNWCRRLEHELILVLDNAEDAMEEKVRDSFIQLLKDMRKCSQFKLKFLITSRRSDIDRATGLNVKAIKLGPLDLQESIEVLRNDAKFESNSEDLRDNLQRIAELCEHIPLALQLAGHLLSSESEYTVEELMEKLQNSPTKTLGCESMMEIAFEKLDESLQSALVCLSVFVRSFDRNAAKALLGVNYAEYLTKLKERCLIQKQDNRYLIHLLIRSYARQIGKKKFPHILAHGQQTFLEYFLSLILSNAKTYWGKDTCKDSFDLFNAERLNYESTLGDFSNRKIRNCRQLEDVVNNCRLVAPYIGACVPINLYEDFLNGLLHFAKAQEKVIHRVEILCLLYHEGRKRGGGRRELQDEAIKLHDENSHLFEQNSLSEVFYASHFARYLLQDCNRREEVEPVLQKALSVYEKVKPECFEKENPESTYDVARIRGQMGHNAKSQERTEEACENYLEALKLLKDGYGNHILTAFAHKDVADSYLYVHQYSKAEENYQRAMGILEDMQKAEHREAIPVFKNWGICFEQSSKFGESREKYEKGSDIAENTIEGNHKWKVWIKTYLALLLYTKYPGDVSTANRIATEVLQMGKQLKMDNWPMKKELEEMRKTH